MIDDISKKMEEICELLSEITYAERKEVVEHYFQEYMGGVLYSEDEIKEILMKEFPKMIDTITNNFDELKEEMKKNEYFMDRVKDMVIEVFLEIVTDGGKQDG